MSEDRPGRPTGTVAVGYAGPWSELLDLWAEELTDRQSRPAVLAVLGARDELAVPGGEDADAGTVSVQVYGHHAVVGPNTPTGEPSSEHPCPRCLARRWQAVRSGQLRNALELGAGTRAVGRPPWGVPFLTDALAALLAARAERDRERGAEHVGSERVAGTDSERGAEHVGSERGAGTGSERGTIVHLLDLETLRVSGFPLLADAECPRCDRRVDDGAEQARIEPVSRPKRAPGDFRLRAVADYRLSLPAFVNPVAGMLGPSVVPDLVSASTASTVGCFTMRSGDYLRECFWGGHTPSYRASVEVGLLEGLERFAGMRARGKRTTVVASYDDLGERALDPRTCGLYTDEFHRASGVRPFSPSRPIPWVWGWSLRDERPLLVPEILAYYHAPGGLENRFVQESSNGCASGGCLEEAIYYGLMETVERDAFLLAWYGRLALPEIDGRTSARPGTRALVDRLEMYGYRARFFDTRISFPIPVVTAVAERIDGGPGRLCFGAGASLDPEAALWAGLCEIATDAVNLVSRTVREERRLRAMAEDFDRVQVLHDHPLLYGLPEMAHYADFLTDHQNAPAPVRQIAEGSIAPSDDLREDLRRCVDAVAAAGFDVVVVDQTMPEQRASGLHTVSVLVPGLLPMDFGWRRQRALTMPRLRTAPRAAGLLEHDLRPDQLNPAPHPFP
ncbi:TOMM precursor leader peptide-binding protein [Kitasatospora sp. NA04385]|uniref:TOMM precursor leader peptide-binding protein n=1 Tax=Kitasatospora sp. NA04385 TaxID=2742135 RepID=UPI0015917BCF|nr:TOMM precursor leader peptide-binding protein [Kitasatospora sp. NA04385]QKW18194.1 TOMM precursor leader peptide-binding protein [Kitasatospora sp. NA04385]